jgi:hypothetical protein
MPNIRDAVRCVGYLLENNQTSQVFARNTKGKALLNPLSSEACKFCLSGAVSLVSYHVLKDNSCCPLEIRPLYTAVQDALNIPRYDFLCQYWDNATQEKRDKMVQSLKAV